MVRSEVDNIIFKSLNLTQCGDLTIPFTLDEVKQAMQDYNSYKSTGSDGVNFGFIKDFWEDLKGDFICYISEFQRNGKSTKGINSTFTTLISKVEIP